MLSEMDSCPNCRKGIMKKTDAGVLFCNACHYIPEGPVASPLNRQEGGNHYKNMKIQPVEFCQKNGLNHCESSIVKYASRHKNKNGAEDVRKIIHYAELLLELEYGEKYERT